MESTDLEDIVERTGGGIPLCWSRGSRKIPTTNLGDSLSPVVVAALSGLRIDWTPAASAQTRMAAIGTIGQRFAGGTVHYWGTGFDAKMNVVDPSVPHYLLPPETRLVPHALRGPHSRAVLARVGIHAPQIYGDPAWFMPRIHPSTVAKRAELGVVLHISETTARTPEPAPYPEFARYHIDDADSGAVKLISTYHNRDYRSLTGKLDELLSCKRIVSTGFHGMVLADAYRIPCAYFALEEGESRLVDPWDHSGVLDHRFADFYAGCTRPGVPAYCQPRLHLTDWTKLIRFIDDMWTPVEDRFEDLLSAFPLPRRVDAARVSWGNMSALESLPL